MLDIGNSYLMNVYTVAIAAFANFVPEIVELVGNRPKYAGTYKVMRIRFFSYLFLTSRKYLP